MRSVNLPPHAPTLMESTRAIGYSLEAAIADIIDNSIAAKATKIDIDFFPIGDAYITITDNGLGMCESELISSMQYGSRNPNEQRELSDLGRYGLGMKTASLSQCRKLTVISKQNGKRVACRWDLDHVLIEQQWSLLILDNSEIDLLPGIEKLEIYESGTIVLWNTLDKMSAGEINFVEVMGKKMDFAREHISLVFHRYLAGEVGQNKISMYLNNRNIDPIDPFLSKKSTQIMDEEHIIVRGDKITVKPYILPHVSKLSNIELKNLGGKDGLRKQQGFYIYRNKRLLIWGTWFKMMRQGDLSKLARVQVDIPNSLDDLWTLDIKKSTATPPEEVRKNLAVIISKIADGSKNTYLTRHKKEISDNIVHIWTRAKTRDNAIKYEVNREHPLIISLNNKYPNAYKEISFLLGQIECNIPLNSLYIDLTNDEKIDNDSEMSNSDIISLLKSIIISFSDPSQRYAMVQSLENTEPFIYYKSIIEDALKKGELV